MRGVVDAGRAVADTLAMAFKIFRFGCSVVLALILLGVGAILWSRGRSEPAAWQEQRARLESKSDAEREALAAGAEERLRRVARRTASRAPGRSAPLETPSPRDTAPSPEHRATGPAAGGGSELAPPQPQDGVTLSLDELNALLEERATRWLAQARRDGRPLPLSDPVLALEGDHLVLYAQLATPGGDLLLGLPFEARVDESGGVARLLGVRLGQLPLPGVGALPRLLRAAGDSRLDRLADKAEDATDGYAFDPVLELDGETLRITSLSLDPVDETVRLGVGAGR